MTTALDSVKPEGKIRGLIYPPDSIFKHLLFIVLAEGGMTYGTFLPANRISNRLVFVPPANPLDHQ
jgi:hypothetical protein